MGDRADARSPPTSAHKRLCRCAKPWFVDCPWKILQQVRWASPTSQIRLPSGRGAPTHFSLEKSEMVRLIYKRSLVYYL